MRRLHGPHVYMHWWMHNQGSVGFPLSRYVKSRSDTQLEGQILYKSELEACEPLVTTTDNGVEKTLSPCGLIANR